MVVLDVIELFSLKMKEILRQFTSGTAIDVIVMCSHCLRGAPYSAPPRGILRQLTSGISTAIAKGCNHKDTVITSMKHLTVLLSKEY